MENITIRLEEPKDYRTVEELTRAAFNTPDRIDSSKIDCPMEHHMVHLLRKKDGIMELNFIAEIDGRIVGHIIYSHAHILQPNGSKVDVLNFGPISVWPELQRKGIGGALMNHSIEEAKRLGYGAILFFGHPEYYPRFGFCEAKHFGIADCNGDNFPAFMAMELKENFLKGVSGRFIEADIYNDDLNREQAKRFDQQFFVTGGELKNTIIVAVKAIILFNKKALIIQRAEDDAIGANTWEFAGGKLDFGEDLVTALKREVKEEVGLTVDVGKLLYATTFKTSENRQLVVLSYMCTAHDDVVSLSSEHKSFIWADREQMLGLLEKPIINDMDKYSAWSHILGQ